MKTIIENSTKISKYLIDDDTPVTLLSDRINVGEPHNLKFIICDLNRGNASVIEDVSEAKSAGVEGDWVGNKFIYDDGWYPNPDWVEPRQEYAE